MSKKTLLQPEEIKEKAQRQYMKYLSAWLADAPFFPLYIPGIGALDDSLAVAQQQVQSLKNGSKEVRGYGYSIEWQDRHSRHHGRNLFPERVVFETQSDFLRFIGKQREFGDFASAVECIRHRIPELESWMHGNRSLLLRHLNVVEKLLDVVDFFRRHPRPGVFAREIPLSVDTKFIEQNSGILEQWLDRVLPPETIRSDERRFERRFGLRYDEPHVLLRFLDPELQRRTGCLWPECSVSLHSLAKVPIAATTVILVENKVNLLTFPPVPSAIAMGGTGNAIVDLTYVTWLSNCSIWYWGDLDVEGIEILSRLRIRFPQTRSFLMDDKTVHRWKDSLGVPGTGRQPVIPPLLTEPEAAAFCLCSSENIRIEQERIPQAAIVEAATEILPL